MKQKSGQQWRKSIFKIELIFNNLPTKKIPGLDEWRDEIFQMLKEEIIFILHKFLWRKK